MSIYDVFSGGNRPFDKEEWAAAKQAQRKEAYELIDNTCSEMCIRDSYCMNLCGKAKHKVDLGADALGNLTRIENELSKLPVRLEACLLYTSVSPFWVFPYPILKRLLDDFLLRLCRRGFLCIEHRFFIAVFVIHIIKDTGVTQV